MSYTNQGAVKGILLGDYDDEESPDLTPFIDSANSLVLALQSRASAKGRPIDSSQAEMIERWLSAHFYCVSDSKLAASKTGESSGVFQGKTAMYLESTTYGQQAIMLDPSGCLQSVGRKVASLNWFGKQPSLQKTVEERDV